jgi:hypothetical protein
LCYDSSGNQKNKNVRHILKKYLVMSKLGSISVEASLLMPRVNPMPAQIAGHPVNFDHPHHFADIRWGARIVGVSAALLALMAYLFFGVAHGSLAQIRVGNQVILATDSQATVARQVGKINQTHRLKLHYQDGTTKSFSLAETGVSIDATQTAVKAKAQLSQSWLRRIQWWQPIELPLYTKTDTKRSRAFITNHATRITKSAADAALVIEGGTAVIKPEIIGESSVVPTASAAIAKSIAMLESRPLGLKPTPVPASITAKDLEASRSKVQAVIGQPVSFVIAGRTIKPSAADVATWIDLTPVPSDKTVDVNVNSGRVLQYIDAIAKRYVTAPRSRLVTTTDSGQVVLDAGSNGIAVVNRDKTATTVAAELMQNKPVQIELTTQYATAQTVEVAPADKWFVVDVTAKRMYAYEKNTLVRSFLVSAGAPATPTVIGKYKIYAKYASQDMSGANADGSRYFQPAVPYVNYFYGGYAIHGNYWRSAEWFGNVNSSHGCVGINVEDSAWIYNWAPIGTTVITHT